MTKKAKPAPYRMTCPYCDEVFGLSENQVRWNHRFKCPYCHRYNEGSISSNNEGVLIGTAISDCYSEGKEEIEVEVT